MANRHRARRPSSRAITEAIFLTRFPQSRMPGDGAHKRGGDWSARSRDYRPRRWPVNWRWAARDFLTAL